MTIRFFFNNPGKAKGSTSPYSIYVEFHYEKISFKHNTGIKLKYKHFKSTNNFDQMVTAAYQKDTKLSRAVKIKEFKKIVNNIELVVDKHYKGFISNDDLHQAFKDCLRDKLPVKSNLFEFFDKFIDYQAMKGNAPKTLYVIKGTRSILQQIQLDYPDIVLNVFDLNIEFFDKFRKVCISRGYEIVTYNKYLKWMKSMMNWMIEGHLNANFNLYYKSEKEMNSIEKEPLALHDDEIKSLWDHTFTNISREQHRDMFVFQLLSGQRHGEMASLAKSLISVDETKKIWYAYSEKTGKTQKIPLTEVMMEIYFKYKKNGKFPVKTNQKRNLLIKDVFKEVGLSRDIKIIQMYLGDSKPIITILPLHDAITTHVARASLITMLSRDQVSHVIKQLSGHSSDKEIKRYQGNDLEYLTKVMNQKSKELFNK